MYIHMYRESTYMYVYMYRERESRHACIWIRGHRWRSNRLFVSSRRNHDRRMIFGERKYRSLFLIERCGNGRAYCYTVQITGTHSPEHTHASIAEIRNQEEYCIKLKDITPIKMLTQVQYIILRWTFEYVIAGFSSPGLDCLIGSIEISWSCSTLASFSGLRRARDGNWYTWYPERDISGNSLSITCWTVWPGVQWSCVQERERKCVCLWVSGRRQGMSIKMRVRPLG